MVVSILECQILQEADDISSEIFAGFYAIA